MPKVFQSAQYAWDKICASSANVVPNFSGTAPKQGVTKTNRDDSSPQQALSCVMIGIPGEVAPQQSMVKNTSAVDVEKKIVLEHRRTIPLTPYKADSWE
jgi:hypothetical protein